MLSGKVSRKVRLGSRVLLIAGMLGLIPPGRLLAQPSGSSVPPATPGTPAGSPSAPPGAANQPFNVNPITGLSSVSATNWRPLTGRERWKLYWKMNYASAGAYVGPVFTALVLDQASNSPSAWGGGFEGYGKRLGSRLATAILQGTFQAALAAPLHEDVRYISSGQTGFTRRLRHAVAFSFLTYNNQGHTTVNIANLTSYYAATAVSTTWIPLGESKGKYIVTNGTEQILLSIPINIVQEFWPEIVHKVFRRP